MDDPVGAGQVGLEEGVGAGGDGVAGHEAEAYDVDPQVVELAVVGVPCFVHDGIVTRSPDHVSGLSGSAAGFRGRSPERAHPFTKGSPPALTFGTCRCRRFSRRSSAPRTTPPASAPGPTGRSCSRWRT